MPLRISRHEAGQPTAIGPQGQSKGLECVPVFLLEGAVPRTAVVQRDASARKGLNNETTVPPKLLPMNLLTFKQFGIL